MSTLLSPERLAEIQKLNQLDLDCNAPGCRFGVREQHIEVLLGHIAALTEQVSELTQLASE